MVLRKEVSKNLMMDPTVKCFMSICLRPPIPESAWSTFRAIGSLIPIFISASSIQILNLFQLPAAFMMNDTSKIDSTTKIDTTQKLSYNPRLERHPYKPKWCSIRAEKPTDGSSSHSWHRVFCNRLTSYTRNLYR